MNRLNSFGGRLCAALVVAGIVGCAGTPGSTGEQGPAGGNGANGTNGANGMNGTNGMAGVGKELFFAPISVALSNLEKQSVLVTPSARVNGVDVPVTYTTELRSGAQVGANTFGRLIMVDGGVIKNPDGTDVISNYSDFSSILKVGSKLYEFTHFESLPGAMYFSELNQAADGTLSVTSTKPVDFSSIGGIWDPCAGSVSPWGTHLASEEYPGDGRAYETGTTLAQVMGSSNVPMVRYWGFDPNDAGVGEVKAVYNPYRYGYVVEVAVDAGTPSVQKHYAAGRRALELAYVMPDRKTAYLTDDGTNDALYMFIAKNAGDLSEGRLFAARWLQTSPRGAPGGRAEILWVELGSNMTDAQVKAMVEGGTKFSDLFETMANNPDGGACDDPTFRSINADTGRECLRLKADAGDVASRLESRRYAAYVGATTEFRKSEGITFNPELGRLYVAFSEVNNGMLDNNSRDVGGPNHIAVKQNYCGAVYEFTIAPNTALGSGYVAESARALVEGIPLDPAGGKDPAFGYPVGGQYNDPMATSEAVLPDGGQTPTRTNACSVSGIANPDNITYIPGYHTLIIGEDTTDGHQNDVVWSLDLISHELTRIMSTPYGAEATGAYWYPNINGKAYLKLQIQHPYSESDNEKAPNASHRQAYVGYLGPFPSME